MKKILKANPYRERGTSPLLREYIDECNRLADSLLHPDQDVVVTDLSGRIKNLVGEIRRLKLSKS